MRISDWSSDVCSSDLIQILARRQKNNPLYVGDPGVGKTAIAEGLAKRIVEGEVPEALADATIFALDMGALLAGTRYRDRQSVVEGKSVFVSVEFGGRRLFKKKKTNKH